MTLRLFEAVHVRRERNTPPAFYGDDQMAPLQVRIVEEHHEVIPYWETIKQPFNLLHVDAHEDTASPSVVDPQGRMRSSMSANDVFILSSLIRGKVLSFTWVWPAWDVLGPRHKKLYDEEYVEGRLETIANSGVFLSKAGSIKTRNRDGLPLAVGCACLYFNESRKLVKCEVGDDDFERSMRKKLDSDSVRLFHRAVERACDFRGAMLQQHVSDVEMAEGLYLQAASLARPAPLVLDIDEDFFSVV